MVILPLAPLPHRVLRALPRHASCLTLQPNRITMEYISFYVTPTARFDFALWVVLHGVWSQVRHGSNVGSTPFHENPCLVSGRPFLAPGLWILSSCWDLLGFSQAGGGHFFVYSRNITEAAFKARGCVAVSVQLKLDHVPKSPTCPVENSMVGFSFLELDFYRMSLRFGLIRYMCCVRNLSRR